MSFIQEVLSIFIGIILVDFGKGLWYWKFNREFPFSIRWHPKIKLI